MEQQQQASQNLADAAIAMVAENRFKERTKYLEEMLDLPRSEFLSTLPFSIGDEIMPTPIGTLIEVFARLKANEGHHMVIREALLEFSENEPNTEVVGRIFGYHDHPDGKYRVEVQLNKQLDWTLDAAVPQFVMTLVLEEHAGGAVVTGFLAERNEWVGMQLSAPWKVEEKPEVDLSKIFAKRSKPAQPAAIPTAVEKVLSNLPSLDLSAPVEIKSNINVEVMAKPPVDKDGTMLLYAPSSEKLAVMGQDDQPSVREMVKNLLARGHRMPEPFATLVGKKLKAEVTDIEQVKFFLDEVFRAGNLWLHDQLTTALKAEKQGSIDTRQTVFALTITGNWQEYRGPIDAVVKMKAYWLSDKERSVELFRISGPMQL